MVGASHRFLPNNLLARALVVPALVFIATITNRNYMTDFWHHLARGRAMVEYGGVLPQEIFTYTIAGQAVRDPNWLTQLAFYGLYRVGGLPLVVTVNSLLLAAVLGLIVWLCQRNLRSALLSAGFGLAAAAGLWQLLIVRPQTVSLTLFAGLYALLLAAERRPRWLLAAPPLCALWVNAHGAFPIGLVLIGCFTLAAACDAWRLRREPGTPATRRFVQLAATLLACVAATLANPYGWRIYEYVLVTSGQATGRAIEEWRPASWQQLSGVLLYASVAAMAVTVFVHRRRLTARDWVLVGCFLLAALQAVRMLVWWWVVIPPLAARLWAKRVPVRLRDSEADAQTDLSAWAFCGALLLGMALSLPWCESFSPLVRNKSPRLEAELDGLLAEAKTSAGPVRVFTRFEWGEFLTWTLPQRQTIFMDGRMENYPPRVWDEYLAINCGDPVWRQVLDRYQVNYLLLDRQCQGQLIEQVAAAVEWTACGDAGRAVLFRRVQDPAALAKD